MKSHLTIAAALCFTSMAPAQNLAGDEALSKVLLEGEGWQEVGSGYGFTDGACPDAEGNVYFSDLRKNVIHKITPDGKVVSWFENAPSVSGMKFGPDGRLYACTQGPRKQVVAITLASKDITVLADDVQPNDLIVAKNGFVYFTETVKGQVTGIEIKGSRMFAAATKLNAPNGITVSPDGGTLAVSEYRGANVWTYRVESDGRLSAGAPYMTLQTPAGKAESAGDGMTVDSVGRYYVTSAVGIQMFDATGRLSGVIEPPQNKGTVSCAFGGAGLQYLYVCSADKVFRRKLQAKGTWLFAR